MNPNKVQKISTVFSYLFLIVLFGTIAVSIYSQDWHVLFISIAALFLIFIPDILSHRLHILLPSEVKLAFLLFICASLLLGSIYDYYEKFSWWDDMLHFSSAVGLGILSFSLIFMLTSKRKIKTNYILFAIFSFSLTISLGTLWEIFEFFMDNTFGLNMQKTGLFDTMSDLMVDTTGALITSIAGYFYIKFDKKIPLIRLKK